MVRRGEIEDPVHRHVRGLTGLDPPAHQQRIVQPARGEQVFRVAAVDLGARLVRRRRLGLELQAEAGRHPRGRQGTAIFHHRAVAIVDLPLGMFVVARLGGEKGDLAGPCAVVGNVELGPGQRAFQSRLVRGSPQRLGRGPLADVEVAVTPEGQHDGQVAVFQRLPQGALDAHPRRLTIFPKAEGRAVEGIIRARDRVKANGAGELPAGHDGRFGRVGGRPDGRENDRVPVLSAVPLVTGLFARRGGAAAFADAARVSTVQS